VTYALEAGCPLLRITIDLDWNEPEYLLKMHFPTAYTATHARFGAPFGSVLRPQVGIDLASEAKWEVPFSRYLSVFDEGEMEGLFVATEAKYGTSVRDGNIGLSLVRSPRMPGFEGHGTAWPKHLSRLKIDSPYTDIGRHTIRLVLGLYTQDLPQEYQPAATADTLFTKPLLYQGAPLPPVLTGMEGGQTLIPAWVVPLPDKSWLLRLHEISGHRGTLRLHVAPGWKMERTDLEGKTVTSVVTARGVTYTPYQIVTIRFSKNSRRRTAR
jgi:alpha-mannosidase